MGWVVYSVYGQKVVRRKVSREVRKVVIKDVIDVGQLTR